MSSYDAPNPSGQEALSGNTPDSSVLAHRTRELDLAAFNFHDDLRVRADLDEALVQEYVQLLVDGSEPPPLDVFDDGENRWCSDGLHRWHAAGIMQRKALPVTIHKGTLDEAVRFALSANFRHGKRPTKEDAKAAYKIAKRRGMLDISRDGIAERAARLLGCSIAWAYELAKADVDALQAEKQAKAFAAKAKGKNNVQAAKEAGVDEKSVRNWKKAASEKFQARKNPSAGESIWTSDDIPSSEDNSEPTAEQYEELARQKEAEATSLRRDGLSKEELAEYHAEQKAEQSAREHHGDLVRALNRLMHLPSPEEMRAYDYRKMDHEIDPQVDAAIEWLTTYRDLGR